VAASVGVLVIPLSPALAARAIDLATTAAVPSRTVIQLIEAIMRTRFVTTGKLATAAAMVLAVVGLAIGHAPAAPKDDWQAVKNLNPMTGVEKADVNAGLGLIYFSRDGRFYTLSPKGENEQRILLGATEPAMTAQPSPDGQMLAYWQTSPLKPSQASIVFADRSGKMIGERVLLPVNGGYRRFCWSRDGTQLHVSQSSGKTPKGGVEHFTVDIKTRTVKALEILRGHIVTDWSRDGKFFLTTYVGETERWTPKSIHLMNVDGTEHKQLAKTESWCGAMCLSPDGSQTLCVIDGKLSVVNVANPNATTLVEGIPDNVEITGAAWTPDGKRILYCVGTVQFLDKDELQALDSRLVIADQSGKNAKVLRAVKGESIDVVYCR
jgi:Tol biopolymer transport system component